MTKLAMSKEREKNLRKLAKLMNTRHQLPFPINKPLLELFDLAITPTEVDFLIRMGTEPHSYQEAASLSDLSDDSFRSFFEGIIRKGFIWLEPKPEEEDQFFLPGIMVGWVEMYLADGSETPEKKEFAGRLDNFIKSFKKMNFFPFRNLMNYRVSRKTNPHQSIVPMGGPFGKNGTKKVQIDRTVKVSDTEVYLSQNVYDLINKYGNGNNIALIHCLCRQWHKMVGEPCRFELPSEACIGVGRFTGHLVDYGFGRYIGKDQALEIIQATHDKGAVHQVFHERENVEAPEAAICNCCWDCCGIFGSYNRGILPLFFKSYYQAQITDNSSCTGCGTCEKYCPVQAISIIEQKAVVDLNKCIGCGQCEHQCPEDIPTMVPNERQVFLPIQKISEARIAI